MRINTDLGAMAGSTAVAATIALVSASNGFLTTNSAALSTDRMLLLAMSTSMAFTSVFVVGHLAFRQIAVSHRLCYSALGALAMIVAMMVFADAEARNAAIVSGAFIPSLALPAAAGWLIGSFYHWFAKYDVEGDDISALDAAVRNGNQIGDIEESAGVSSIDAGSSPVHIRTATTEYFGGPTQVRSSLNAAFAASVTGVMVSNIVMWSFVFAGSYDSFPTSNKGSSSALFPIKPSPIVQLPDFAVLGDAVVSVLGSGLLMSLILLIPVTLIILVGHLGLRAFGRSGYADYGLAGFAMPPIIGLALIFMLPLGLQLAIPFAMTMMLYRKLAGLEPLAVREDIEVTDRRSLVAADHARRRFARVISRG
jgi:hypothetical protein